MLDASSELLDRLRHRWPFILEDEAQDSSEIQQRIISSLAGSPGNWVRVGDPNQAIFETFTTADPKLLLDFIAGNPHVDMPESGRCQPSIMGLANFLIDWARTRHPSLAIRNALVLPSIRPAPRDDPQPNPPDDPAGVQLIDSELTPEQEINEVAASLAEWLPNHQDQTVAILASTNAHAARMVAALKRRNIPCRELLHSTAPTRAAIGALSYVLNYLSAPDSASRLAQAYKVWRRDWREDASRQDLSGRVARILAGLKRVEDYVSPGALAPSLQLLALGAPAEKDLRAQRNLTDVDGIVKELTAFRRVVALWHGATALPMDQLVLTIGRDVFVAQTDLALVHKLALLMRQLADENPHWRLPDLIPGLQEIARNERRFIGFSSDDAGFNPEAYRGVVVVATMHKAKGLEWDRVYLMAVNNYDYPSAQPGDQFISEKWFLRDRLNLEAETLAQLEAATSGDRSMEYVEGDATRGARLDYARERLRLLYVGITRARRELVVTCNTGRRGDAVPALPLEAMRTWREGAGSQTAVLESRNDG
jgi:DNA helicase-2/ATP-dependent DNA helicase PcrA